MTTHLITGGVGAVREVFGALVLNVVNVAPAMSHVSERQLSSSSFIKWVSFERTFPVLVSVARVLHKVQFRVVEASGKLGQFHFMRHNSWCNSENTLSRLMKYFSFLL